MMETTDGGEAAPFEVDGTGDSFRYRVRGASDWVGGFGDEEEARMGAVVAIGEAAAEAADRAMAASIKSVHAFLKPERGEDPVRDNARELRHVARVAEAFAEEAWAFQEAWFLAKEEADAARSGRSAFH